MFSARDLGTGQENDRNVIPTVTVVTADSGSINFIRAPLGWVPALVLKKFPSEGS